VIGDASPAVEAVDTLLDAENDVFIAWRCGELVELVDALRFHACSDVDDCDELDGCELARQLTFVAGDLRGRLRLRRTS
jgi:hypothetical protein